MSGRYEPIRSRVVPLPIDNVDTDQIIPARYLKGVDRSGLAAGLFAGWRQDPSFVLNRRELAAAQILVAGENFGCGSSREHAAWALHEHGFRAVVSSRFADIFRGNALKNGLLTVELPAATTRSLLDRAAADGGLTLEIDLAEQAVREPDGTTHRFDLDPFSRRCLLEGVDQLGYLLSRLSRVESWEASRTPPVDTRSPQPESRGGAS